MLAPEYNSSLEETDVETEKTVHESQNKTRKLPICKIIQKFDNAEILTKMPNLGELEDWCNNYFKIPDGLKVHIFLFQLHALEATNRTLSNETPLAIVHILKEIGTDIKETSRKLKDLTAASHSRSQQKHLHCPLYYYRGFFKTDFDCVNQFYDFQEKKRRFLRVFDMGDLKRSDSHYMKFAHRKDSNLAFDFWSNYLHA
ncbi:hypothetical protein BpHYR1_001562 [Brachionus plicatilis]|uniref:Uncharacterized protein n=1 Tax=Brachionus plicatilis TaxID=10195 RepID=A0A3M7QAM5_BRAPC|nr:hypothetical protein BpHYR1_001562 [Brachionus plicatilis]